MVGCGYVGLPLAVAAAETGFPVLGFDVDARKIDIPSYQVKVGDVITLAPRAANPSSNAIGYLTGVTLVQVESGL